MKPYQATILIADDHAENIRVLMNAVEDEHRVLAAKDGRAALAKAFEHKPDLVLLDIMMPEMDGFEVCRRLKAHEDTRNIPIIFVTAMDGSGAEEQGLLLGAIDYIRKPFQLAVVRARIRNHLRLKRKTDMLEDLVRIDGLTELRNRRGFDENLALEWNRARRNSTPLSLILLDIDCFKGFNDAFGHAMGDECLVKVAREIQCQVKRSSDFVARYGGEEFAVVMPESGIETAVTIAESIRQGVEKLALPHSCSPTGPCVTVSAGAASIVPRQGVQGIALIEAADAALYAAKAAGRNRVSAG